MRSIQCVVQPIPRGFQVAELHDIVWFLRFGILAVVGEAAPRMADRQLDCRNLIDAIPAPDVSRRARETASSSLTCIGGRKRIIRLPYRASVR